MIHQRKILKAIAYAILLCFTSLTGAQPLYAVPANNHTPSINTPGAGVTVTPNGEILNIHQTGQTAVNKWNDFSIGADATVNFTGTVDGFNSFNYVKDGPVSEIYGQLNAIGGNIFIANPAGVQIGNSAQINVGSLYVTNRELEQSHLDAIAGKNTAAAIGDYLRTNGTIANPAAELMSLGSITSATSVTFDGSRIVLDTDRLFSGESSVGTGEMAKDNIKIFTNDENEVILGYTSYTTTDPTNPNAGKFGEREYFKITANNQQKEISGYMWVEDLFQLQAMDTKLDGWFALRNAIDANYTADASFNFNPIGTDKDTPFKGRFDGLGYNIFGLNINRPNDNNVGLFGYAGNGAYIRNFTINGGTITGGTNVGAAVGAFGPGTFISNITNTADVTGTKNVGGVVGSGTGATEYTELRDLVNIGSVNGESNVGGIIGSMEDVTIAGETYNLGAVTGDKGNVGGIAGLAISSTIGDNNDFRIYNQLNVTGGWNVGGIVGYIYGDSSISNVENHGNITAMGSMTEEYAYHQYASDTQEGWNNQYINTRVANAGGIAGQSGNDDSGNSITIDNVHNDGNVTTDTAEGTHKKDNEDSKEYDYYIAGNVGGIVGRARYTNITNAENSENLVAGAHNVGGIAGYLADGKVSASGNNGGDITATGARNSDDTDFAKEKVDGASASQFIIGNIGGIVGYLYGRSAQIEDAANRGSVHSAAIDDPDNVLPISEASNVGGIAGKVSMGNHTKDPNATGDKAYTTEELLNMFRNGDTSAATIRNSYNTGSVEGYTGVGGIAGQMVKGSVTGSYNLGTLSSTRTATDASREALNMGGIVGDMTAATDPTKSALIYDVYNAGTIGDSTYTYVGRHVGGIVGRFSGTLEKAYNTGDIYNGYSVVGGVVGWWNSGNITNVFNTGNITVVNKDTNGLNSHVGGIVGSVNAKRDDGAAQDTQKTLSYAYNLGTIRSFIDKDHQDGKLHGTGPLRDNINVVSGIVGGVTEYDTKGGSTKNTVTIDNVYSTGNIYAARWDKDANNGNGAYVQYDKDRVGAIWAQGYTNEGADSVTVTNSFFIKPIDSQDGQESMFSDISDKYVGAADEYKAIEWNQKDIKNSFKNGNEGFKFIDDLSKGHAAASGNNYAYGWRIEEGTLPILYAFTPNTAKDQSWNTGNWDVQFGTAANPLLTIIQGGGEDVSLDWNSLGLTGAGGLALYGGGDLTLTGFGTELGRYYNGIIFSAGDLYIDATGDAARHNLGSGSQLYGQNVTFNAGTNDTTLYGSITSTNGSIKVDGANVSVIGSLTSSKEGDEPIYVPGIAENAQEADGNNITIDKKDLNDPNKAVATVEQAYSHKIDEPKKTGDITITADKNAEVLYGNMGEGKITTGGNFTVSGKDSVYVDSDLHIGGDLNLNSDGEIVLDLSNMGDISKENLHINFLDHFNKNTAGGGAINVGGYKEGSSFSGDFMIGLDMWEDATTPGEEGAFNLDKYDVTKDDISNSSGLKGKEPHKLVEDINALNIDGVSGTAQEHTFIWVENAEQLAGIQKYKNDKDKLGEKTNILSYNFALKDNIDASSIENYEGIASKVDADGKPTEAFTGTFDGRGLAIIGLDVNDNGTTEGKDVKDAGIFGNIGVVRNEEGEVVQTGTVKDLGVYSSKFTGGDTAGAIAGRSEGTITGITTLGNRVEVTGKGATTEINRGTGAGNEADKPITVGAAGGIAGINAGTITNSHVSDTVIAGEPGNTTGTELMTVAGGVVGINQGNGASIGDFATYWLKGAPDVTSTSAVLTNVLENKNSNLHGLGGIAGINENGITNVAAFGVTNGTYGSQSNKSNEYVGGIAGVNYFAIVGAYNESVVTGSSSIGGIAGKNDYRNDLAQEYQGFYTGAEINNSVNAGSVTVIGDGEYAGGIVGSNYGWVNYGRNTGSVSGTNSVGGIAGLNAYGAGLKNLSNAIAAEISGEENVGGIAGTNAGEITAESNIVNEGKITGKTNVGGVAGVNEKTGVIRGGEDESGSKRTTNLATITGNTYVGGIAGVNKGEIANTNSDVTFAFDDGAPAQYVGGVAGKNEGKITNATNASDIIAENAEYVGGITGVNAENAVLENAGNSGNVFGGSHVGGVAAVNNSSHDGGKITNSGIVTAENGGAAGIFYENEAALNNVELVNTGSVTGQSNNHGTGGIIGVNNGNITNSKLLNNGSVSGNNNTGGLIGVNSGTISGSTLANTGYVNAGSGENVGGLIGKNTGSVIGGRNEADTMYVHKIYNNGGVSAQQGTNVGGLIGNNEGKLTAGYNTGNVRGQQNVGGIAGTNNGSISEVFNTVMTGDAEATGSISGVSSVGGLVGRNDRGGTLTDAYNTTAVNGGGVKGNAVGTNDGAVKNVYAWNTNGKLIGGGIGTKENTYSFVSGDGSANFVIPALGQMESGSYEGFGFGSTWKNYDGWSLPMLKVFLTKGEVSQNGVTAADGLAAFNNANSLIVFVPDPETGGMYMTVFSAQIAGSFGPDGVFNPNNLGYDLEGVYVRGNNNGFLHSDGWDRIKNFRERKAELYFHNGGMEYAEEM